MTVRSRLRGAAISAFLDSDRLRHTLADARRRVTGAERAVDFYCDLGSPASYLLGQLAQRLAAAYQVPVRFHLVSGPAGDVDPAPTLRPGHAVRDALDVAARYDVEFPGKKPAEPGFLKRAQQVLLKPRPDDVQLAAALELAHAVWTNDQKALTALMGRYGHEDQMSVPPALATGYGRLRKAGFYQGDALHYGGDWYLGVERVHYLEARLAADTGRTAPPVLARRPAIPAAPPAPAADGAAPVAAPTPAKPLELWFSFRSPYSYLALAQLAPVLGQYDVEVRLRPVLPLVERGAQMPWVKRQYLARDAHREADRLGIPFGRLADPLGAGAQHAIAILRSLPTPDQRLRFALTALRGIWAEALDLADYVDLRTVVERADLDWAAARAALADDGWRTEVADAAADLNAAGLWGVPSFRYGDYATWGQDRLPYVLDRLPRR
ncbi:MAG: DsbA family protein [Kofleriaceae bacterium]